MQRQHPLQQLRHDAGGVGVLGAAIGQLHITAIEHALAAAASHSGPEVAQARHVGAHGAVAEGHQQAGALAHLVDQGRVAPAATCRSWISTSG